MKKFFIAVGLIFLVLVIGLMLLPPTEDEPGNDHVPVICDSTQAPTRSSSKRSTLTIPLIQAGNFELNEKYEDQLKNTYSIIFDSLQFLTMPLSQIPNTELVDLDAATVIQLHAFQLSLPGGSHAKQTPVILLLGAILKDKKESYYFVKDYLLEEGLWSAQMEKLHYLLMQHPDNEMLNSAFLAMLDPADTDHVIDYFRLVNFLDRRTSEEYFTVNPDRITKFNRDILVALLNKVDDYTWLDPYPERDAEEAIKEILKKR